jgi:hypothetical protein
MKILNPATDNKSILIANYDKLLHVLGSFTALVWLDKILSPMVSIIIVISLCCIKTKWNYRKYKLYNPIGDWVANLIGFALFGLF